MVWIGVCSCGCGLVLVLGVERRKGIRISIQLSGTRKVIRLWCAICQ